MDPDTHTPCAATCINVPRAKSYQSVKCPMLSLAPYPHTVLAAPPPPVLCQACHAQYLIAIGPRCSHPSSDPCIATCTSTECLMLCHILCLTTTSLPPKCHIRSIRKHLGCAFPFSSGAHDSHTCCCSPTSKLEGRFQVHLWGVCNALMCLFVGWVQCARSASLTGWSSLLKRPLPALYVP